MIADIDFVGFVDEFQKIIESLVDGRKKLNVVSVVGMPGNGKTTLAQKLYQDPSVKLHFDIRAWCTVSQLYRKRDVWHTLLCQLDDQGIEMVDVDENSMAERIARSLKRKRYLIIIDDIWEIKAWNDLRRYLPNDNNGSRILITTRHQDMAKQISSVISNVHSLRAFTMSESYELLERKAGLKDDYHSEELLQVGHQISLRCKGLPLAIAIVGGHLAKAEKNVKELKKVLAGLSSRILNDKDRPYRVMLQWSYDCLPNHLKPCFLYAGVLASYKLVQVWKLKWLWIAEGLVCNDKFESMEKQAEEYLMDIINRSLVIPTKERSIGGLKEFRMHDLLIDFCLELSEEQNFMLKIYDASSKSYEPEDLTHVDETDGSQKFSYLRRRYHSQIEKPFSSSSGSLHCLRSLLMPFACVRKEDLHSMNMDSRVIQVLDMSRGSENGDIFDDFRLLTHLKYLAIDHSSTLFRSIPPSNHILLSIASLRSLQTLILEYNETNEVNVPDSLWDMENLRNVCITNSLGLVRFEVERSRLEKSSFSGNIETLSTPFFSSASDAEILRKMPRLRKLNCEVGNCWDDSSNCPFSSLDYLLSLKIRGRRRYGETLKQHNFNFPSSLKKLTLRDCVISWHKISKIGRKVPNLEVLKMDSTGEGGTWTVMAGDFPNLRYLRIRMHHYITEWLTTEESFPKLEQLHLDWVSRLVEIPHSFEEVVCLRVITARYCQRSLNDSATKIGKVQKEEMLNHEFVVDVTRPMYDLPQRTTSGTINQKPFSEDVRRPTYDFPRRMMLSERPFSEEDSEQLKCVRVKKK